MIIFDEVQYAENVIRNGCSRKYILVDFKILAKYFLLYKGYTEEKTKEEMLLILRDGQSLIPINYLPQKIDLSIRYAKTEEMKTSSPIEVTNAELEEIIFLPEHLQELAFIYLFLSKWNTDKDGFFIEKSDLKKLLKSASVNNSKLNILDGELERLGYIQFIDYCRKEKIQVHSCLEESDIALRIIDFDNIILYFRQYCGKKIINCVDCNSLVEVKSNRQKYCKCCAKKNKLKQVRDSKSRRIKENL